MVQYGRLLLLPALLLGGAAPASDHPPYRDLNHNGRMDLYEDAQAPTERRIADLIAQMTIDEKVGTMLHASLPSGDPVGATGSRYDMAAVRRMIVSRHVNSAITRLSVGPRDLATQNNEIQRIAAGARLGIPVTISTDPRNHFQAVVGASTHGGGFSL